MTDSRNDQQWSCFGPIRNPYNLKVGVDAMAIGKSNLKKLNHTGRLSGSGSHDGDGLGVGGKAASTSNSESGMVSQTKAAPQKSKNLDRNDSIDSSEICTVDALKEKAKCIMQCLEIIGFKFEGDAIKQIRSKLDLDAPEDTKIKVCLKILKTKLRKSKRKERHRQVDTPSKPTSKIGILNSKTSKPTTYYDIEKQDCLESKGSPLMDAQEADKMLQILISVEKQAKSSTKPGDKLLELLSPKPLGLYWLNNSKLPEIKALWRRRLVRAKEEKKPESWPDMVPVNYRLNNSKKPIHYRIRDLQINMAENVSHQQSHLLLVDSFQPTC